MPFVTLVTQGFYEEVCRFLRSLEIIKDLKLRVEQRPHTRCIDIRATTPLAIKYVIIAQIWIYAGKIETKNHHLTYTDPRTFFPKDKVESILETLVKALKTGHCPYCCYDTSVIGFCLSCENRFT